MLPVGGCSVLRRWWRNKDTEDDCWTGKELQGHDYSHFATKFSKIFFFLLFCKILILSSFMNRGMAKNTLFCWQKQFWLSKRWKWGCPEWKKIDRSAHWRVVNQSSNSSYRIDYMSWFFRQFQQLTD